jgi:hypothetical protein
LPPDHPRSSFSGACSWVAQNAPQALSRIVEVLASSRHFFVLQMLQDLKLVSGCRLCVATSARVLLFFRLNAW